MPKPLKICIDARIPDSTIGGGAKVVIALASAFSKLKDSNEEYHFYTFQDANEWIRPYLDKPCLLFAGPKYRQQTIKRRLAKNRFVRKIWHSATKPIWPWMIRPAVSDGTVEAAEFDLIHFTQQNAFLTSIPSIYQPHDLQHLHIPEFFTQRERFVRDVYYRAFCNQASMVVAMSEWGKGDLLTHFKLPEDKICTISWGNWDEAPIPSSEDLKQTQEKFQLPSSFLFLPAQTWAHKNHIAALETLALLRQTHGLKINLICSGQKNEFFSVIHQRVRQLKLSEQVKFLGFVSELELQCLYRLARALIFPTKFEGWGLPIMEAFAAALPVASSNVTCLPAQVRDAALTFRPNDIPSIADCVLKLWSDETLRAQLIKKGHQRAAEFSWDHTARLFRAHYRRIANRPLTDEDHFLLAQPPLV